MHMDIAPVPSNERQRLAVLRNLGVLDTPVEESYERVVRLAARLFDVPIALVSLVDEHRQWFKARFGVEVQETSRDLAFCAHAIAAENDDMFVVTDAEADPRFADNPFVLGESGIRFYAGQPLSVHGHRVGTLCVVDRRPRQLTDVERETLRDLASVVEDLLSRRELQAVVIELESSESRKAQILATMHDGIILQDASGSIVEWNQAAERMLGLTGDELGGRTSLDSRWEAIRADGTPWPGATHPAMEALGTGAPVENVLMGVQRPGLGLGWLRVNSTPVMEPDHSVSGAITSFTDVTELTTTEQLLRQLEKLQRSALDLLEQGVIVARRDGVVELMNAAAERILGFDAEVLSQRWQSGTWKTFSEDGTEIANADRPIVRTFTTGERVNSEVVGWARRDDTRVLLSLSTAPIPDDSERILVTFVDVTERGRDRQLLELTFANAPIGMALVSHDGRFLAVNDALCQFVGRDQQDLRALTFQDITHPDDLDDDLQHVQQLLDGTYDHYEMDKRYSRPDGTYAHAHLAVAIVRAQTLSHPYFIAQILDIGERIEAERVKDHALEIERAAVAKLVELDLIKTNFVSTVSHELRTPLASMIGYTELLTDGIPPLAPHQTKMLGVVDRNAHRLLNLIEDLLTLSKVELDPQRGERSEVHATDIVNSVIAMMQPLADESGLELVTDLDPGTSAVLGNASQLERVLLNLVGNAIKFTPRGGTITVSTRQTGPDLRMTVEDTGVAIPESELQQLFTPFFRTSTSLTNAIPGTGLGLAISAKIVESHGGNIEARSCEGQGATFVVTLPTLPTTDRELVSTSTQARPLERS